MVDNAIEAGATKVEIQIEKLTEDEKINMRFSLLTMETDDRKRAKPCLTIRRKLTI
jgi:hypothetical protein